MSKFPGELRYTKSHEWARVEGKEAVVGITWSAQDQLGDVVHVELPKVGARVKAGASAGEIESVKAVSELYSPVSGLVVAINDALDGSEDLINSAPFGEGWLFRVAMDDPHELHGLLDAGAYAEHAAAQDH